MKRLIFAAMLVLASLSVINAQIPQGQQQGQQSKVYAVAIDSVNMFGLPFNTLLISNISLQGTTVTVRAALAYSGKINGSKNPFSFTETFEISDTDNISYASVSAAIATKREVRLKQ